MKNKITRRLSLRVKFKSTNMIELVVMDDKNNIQVELIPIKLPLSEEFNELVASKSKIDGSEAEAEVETLEENGIPQPEVEKEEL